VPLEEAEIMRAVGRPVKMTYPGTEGERRGILKSREIAIRPFRGVTGAEYCVVVDVIDFEGAGRFKLRDYRERTSRDLMGRMMLREVGHGRTGAAPAG
jgi:hypothetical protein